MRKILALFLTLIIALSLAACSGDNNATVVSGNTETSTEAMTDPTDNTQDTIENTIETTLPATEPPVTEPVETIPPTTEPPVTEPAATEPVETIPPTTEPPVTEPAATEPVQTMPPTTEPVETTQSYAQENTDSQTVYITKTGKKYHSSETCPGLANAKEIFETTLQEALSKNLGPCARCH